MFVLLQLDLTERINGLYFVLHIDWSIGDYELCLLLLAFGRSSFPEVAGAPTGSRLDDGTIRLWLE